MQLDSFTVLGHSLGGRAAMTTACRYPDRVDGVISIDSPPLDANKTSGVVFTREVLEFMYKLNKKNPSRKKALFMAKEYFFG